ncbi:MAG: RluA family pseudouridine synthase [Treponema sp.]
MTGTVFELTVPPVSQKLRLDAFCSSSIAGMTRSKLKTGLKSAEVNGRPAKLSKTVESGDRIVITWEDPVPETLIPEAIPLDILFENDDVIVVNKDAGTVTHPAAGNWTNTLVQALAYYRLHVSSIHDEYAHCLESEAGTKNFTRYLRTGIVHRLDKPTSGVIITARNSAAEAFLKNEFKFRHTDKYYLAILDGIPPKTAGSVKTSIFRGGRARIRFAASADLSKGKYAYSRYKVLKIYGRYALAVFKIYTGRTHQVRLHAKFIGCPVVGDCLYGRKNAAFKPYGLMLHAYRLKIGLPSMQEKQVFTAPLPRRFFTLLRLLKDHE